MLTTLSTAGQSQRAAIELVRMVPSPVDPAGVATFGVIGLASLVTGMIIMVSGRLPRALGYLAVVNAVLLVTLYFATAAGAQTLILISGGLTSVIVGPMSVLSLCTSVSSLRVPPCPSSLPSAML